jgi:rRNA maturation protein Nop10
MKPYGELHTCPECGEDTEIIVYPYEGPKYMSGRMEDAEPAEGGYTDPEECRECGCGIDYEDYAE